MLTRLDKRRSIIHWIPHCYEMLSNPKTEGSIDNFVQAGKKLAGHSAKRQRGAPWTNAYVHNTVVESIKLRA